MIMINIEFFEACRQGDFNEVKQLIATVDINLKNGEWSPLSIASESNYTEIINLLIEEGANVDCVNANGETPLIKAGWHGNDYIAEKLIKAGADVTIKDNTGWTALMHAARQGRYEIAKLLLTNGVVDEKTIYTIAKKHNHISLLFLLDPSIINHQDENGHTLLMTICKDKHLYLIEKQQQNVLFLYEKGANFYLKDNNGWSALDALISHKQLSDNLQALKEKLILGLEIDQSDENGMGL